jgi:hypothetical protein
MFVFMPVQWFLMMALCSMFWSQVEIMLPALFFLLMMTLDLQSSVLRSWGFNPGPRICYGSALSFEPCLQTFCLYFVSEIRVLLTFSKFPGAHEPPDSAFQVAEIIDSNPACSVCLEVHTYVKNVTHILTEVILHLSIYISLWIVQTVWQY